MRKTRMWERMTLRYRRWMWMTLGILLFVALIIFAALSLFSAPPAKRLTVLLVGSPMVVVSWEAEEKKLLLVTLPVDGTIEAVHGYGAYTLEALWKLGDIEKKSGGLLSQSLEEALATRVQWYIGPHSSDLPLFDQPESSVKQLFSMTGVPAFIGRRYQTNMPLSVFWALSRAIGNVSPDRITTLDLTGTSVFVAQNQPDGSHVSVFDPQRLDALVKEYLEIAAIRKEGMRAIIYNTTSTPFLGQRIGRLLTHVGVLVVSIGNEEPVRDRCIIKGSKKALDSETGQFITRTYRCEHVLETEDGRADVTIYVGKDYERRFLPFDAK